ncbi:pyridoxine 5'-phosphate synthase [Maritalea porphyrae]|uniref:pyridoxine 5'-phosphate synthase n=1 Tax=Maritalea porphyrae TaxID=880732 RepID=UPI0022B053C9|nr:pyridoxine 5'-phosphate synthase [Maritalea porphyrae]MCZ4272624.1 pyridoxine 5'-phosphate synthase [Maritalea porphyrae]
MTALSVNLNKVALLRNQRDLPWPSVVGMARVVLDAGADGITVHPRPDERHIRRSDVYDLAALVRDEYPDKEFNIEGYPDNGLIDLVLENKPHQVTFVPDDPNQATSDHGWDVKGSHNILADPIRQMKQAGIRVSLFIDEDPNIPPDAAEIGADRVEIYTGPFGGTFGTPEGDHHLQRMQVTSQAASAAGLVINAGHDLTLENLPAFLAQVPNVAEVSIGHGITADALLMGFAEAVRQYQKALGKELSE